MLIDNDSGKRTRMAQKVQVLLVDERGDERLVGRAAECLRHAGDH